MRTNTVKNMQQSVTCIKIYNNNNSNKWSLLIKVQMAIDQGPPACT